MTTHPPSQIGRYRIERELGRGTMGVVYEAQDTTLGRTVALKTFGAMAAIAPHERESFEQRFLSEARISATLDDPHVVAVYDVGRDFESGLLFMALEYVRGETLAAALARGPMPWEEAVGIVAKVATALHGAHAHHIVHRDIKPANIMLNVAGEPKIMDFGIAKASAAQLTIAGQVFGTPAYMSPEQASGEEVDGRSDIFSLGAVLYELVTNTRPFEGPTMAATLTKILRDEPRPPSSLVDAPRTLDAVIARALRKQRNARYDSASNFAGDLECLLEGKPPLHATQLTPIETLPAKGSSAPKPALTPPHRRANSGDRGSKVVRTEPATPGPAVAETTPETTPTKSQVPLLAAVALGVTLGVGVVLFLQRRSSSVPAPEVTVQKTEAAPASKPVGPTPLPTPIPTLEAVAPPLSMEATGRAARVRLELRHPFASGSLRIKLDERVILANNIHGMPIRKSGVTSGYDGHFTAELVVPPGAHLIRVEVRSGAGEFIASQPLQVRGGESLRLIALLDKALTLRLE